ncbi:MAG: molybdopterin-dependent oxidoreductase, partial [Cyclobacteriaceae bacterium]|nr:molybdopterin-dependent oxidoreductase [Cyclobacteriaceae bacterium]
MEISSYSHSRRNFVKKMGFLSISFSWVMESCTKGTEPKVPENVEFLPLNYPVKPNQNQVDAWIRVYENGLVEVLTGKIELGQGIRTAVSQMAAEELNTSIDKIRVSMAETGYSPAEGYTAGSRSIETSAMSVRNAAATARVKLLRLASDKFGIELDKLKIADGEIVTPKEKLSFFDLLEGKQIEDTIEENPPLFADSVRKYVGQPIPRKDIEKMVRGKLEYVHDLRFTGMLHARIVRPPAYKAELSSFDEDILKNEPGLNIIRKGSFLAVVCEDEYHCITAVKKASQKAVWNYKDTLPGKVPLKDFLRNMETENQTEEDTGNYKKALEEASITHKATYFKPYIMHASNGPACAVAKYENGKFDIWCHSQGVYPLRASLAELFKMKEEDIHIKGMHGSGMYGHNSADDAAAEAALIAREIPGKHIRVQWSREEENAWEPYGTAMLMDVEAGLDKEGKIKGWKYEVWTD